MFGTKVQNAEPGLLRLQKDVTRDRLRLQQYRELADGERSASFVDAPDGSTVGRLYQVFVAMGEA
jgi:hypothetical protein